MFGESKRPCAVCCHCCCLPQIVDVVALSFCDLFTGEPMSKYSVCWLFTCVAGSEAFARFWPLCFDLRLLIPFLVFSLTQIRSNVLHPAPIALSESVPTCSVHSSQPRRTGGRSNSSRPVKTGGRSGLEVRAATGRPRHRFATTISSCLIGAF